MAYKLYMHPLSSYCHKALIALYETATPFEPVVVNLGDPASRADFVKVWPIGKFPVLDDSGRTVAESTSIIEYLTLKHPGRPLIPADAEAALVTRATDRFYDLHVHDPMQKVIGDRLRPEGRSDPHGVAHAKGQIDTGLAVAEAQMAKRSWAAGDTFSLADCAAAPPLFYIDMVVAPLAPRFPNLSAYLGRLKARPSYARVLKEAEPFFHWVPRDKEAAEAK